MFKSCRPLIQLLAVTLSVAKNSATLWKVANFMKVQPWLQWTMIIQTLIRVKESAFYLSTQTLSHRCEETIGRSIILLILLTPLALTIDQMSGKVATRERLLWVRVELAWSTPTSRLIMPLTSTDVESKVEEESQPTYSQIVAVCVTRKCRCRQSHPVVIRREKSYRKTRLCLKEASLKKSLWSWTEHKKKAKVSLCQTLQRIQLAATIIKTSLIRWIRSSSKAAIRTRWSVIVRARVSIKAQWWFQTIVRPSMPRLCRQ